MKDRFTDRVVIVTGATGGIGSTTVAAFAAEGAYVVLADLSEELLESTAKRLNLQDGRYLTVKTDVSVEEEVKHLVDATVEKFGHLDVIFNNAGIVGAVEKVQNFPTESVKKVFSVNVMGAFFGTKYALQVMQPQKKGVIINTCSINGLRGLPDSVAYTMSKHAVLGLTRTTANENAMNGIRACAVCPSPVNTGMMEKLENDVMAMTHEDKETVHNKMNAVPMGRYAEPIEITNAVLFLASDDASFVSGSYISVDGCFMA